MYSYPHKSTYGDINVNLFDYLHPMDSLDIYVHLPFCKWRCGYCNLFLVTRQDELIDSYLDAIERQILQFNLSPNKINSITIGGGTPLVLSANQLERLLKMLPGVSYAPICIEASPLDTTSEKLAVLKAFKVQRVSLGVQSFLDEELKTLKRAHPTESVHKALDLLCDFPVINIDLIYGIPDQTEKSLLYSLEQAVYHAPKEIFIYPLYTRKGTALEDMQESEEGQKQRMWYTCFDFLTNKGYTAHSMRFFSRQSPNTASCGFEKTIALGCGGRSYLEKLHFCYPYSVNEVESLTTIMQFIDTKDYSLITHGILLNDDELKRRYIIKNLLRTTGIDIEEYRQVFGTDLFSEFPKFDKLLSDEMISLKHCHSQRKVISLTPAGLAAADEIGPLFISPKLAPLMCL
ncbi:MAG: STM4012 family radical SAM protein [Defluviitaleaceae bacterium]|nr:STM4012 family radical SAM protein [Defluviitaleaceae bacterium]